jgi:hypothetical protein
MGGLCDVPIFIYSTYTMWAAKAKGWGWLFSSVQGWSRPLQLQGLCMYEGGLRARCSDVDNDGDDGETMTTVYL